MLTVVHQRFMNVDNPVAEQSPQCEDIIFEPQTMRHRSKLVEQLPGPCRRAADQSRRALLGEAEQTRRAAFVFKGEKLLNH